MQPDHPHLSAAFQLTSPQDARNLYAAWAASYDIGFARQETYQLPEQTARAFVASGGRGPILDIGAGTGLLGQQLSALGAGPVDAADLSPEMLAQALRKDVYRDLFEVDINTGVPAARNSYRGVVSSGMFTHGHVGPEALAALLRVASPGAHFALAINGAFFERSRFGDALQRLHDGQWITGLALPRVAIYATANATAAQHRKDTAVIALFQKHQ